jgi:branched-chain amino acid transport system substrate-binding protein
VGEPRVAPPDSPRRGLLAAAAVVLAAWAAISAGCASPGEGIQAGERVTVYVSVPLRGPQGSDGQDVADGARLALADALGRVGGLTVRAVYMDDTGGRGPRARWSPSATAANARWAAQDSTAIAYLGDFDSGATRFSLPITNEAHLLQVSPASSAIDLVQPYLGAGDQVPDTQPSEQRSFGRVIPSDEAQARAGAAWAKRLGAKHVSAVSDGSQFGAVLVESFRSAASGLTRPRAADLLYYGGTATDVPAAVRADFGQCGPQALMASDALIGTPLLRSIRDGPCQRITVRGPRPSASGVLVTGAAQEPAQLPASGQRFLRAFRQRFGRLPGRYAAYGYEAMAVVLDSIRRAGDSGDVRDAVIDAFFDTRDRHSVLGTYSIDEVGNTTLNRMSGYRVVGGRPAPVAELRVP